MIESIRNRKTRLLPIALLFALTAPVVPPEAEASNGRCVRAELPWPIVLPDGSQHAPGQLRICFSGAYSPVSGMHPTYVDGRFVGIFLSRQVPSEGPVEEREPFMLFRRNAEDLWELQGYALPDGDELISYRMARDALARRTRPGPESWIADRGHPPETPGGGWAVLLASGPH